MSSYRKNFLVVDFSVLPKRPPTDQVEEFLRDFVKLDMADVRNLQLHTLRNCVYIEMHNAGLPPRLAKQHHLRYWLEHNGAVYHIPIYVDGPTTTIRIHDLSPQMANNTITEYLKEYGTVVSITNEVWKNYFAGVPNGVRVVRMKMKKPVPSHITIDNQPSLVTYPKNEKQKTASVHEKKDEQQQTSSSAVINHAKPDNPTTTIAHNMNDDDEDDDYDDDSSIDDSTTNDDHQTTTKRRLSIRTSSDENDQTHRERKGPEIAKDEEGKDPCVPAELGWRVTRSRKCKRMETSVEIGRIMN